MKNILFFFSLHILYSLHYACPLATLTSSVCESPCMWIVVFQGLLARNNFTADQRESTRNEERERVSSSWQPYSWCITTLVSGRDIQLLMGSFEYNATLQLGEAYWHIWWTLAWAALIFPVLLSRLRIGRVNADDHSLSIFCADKWEMFRMWIRYINVCTKFEK